MCGIAGFFVKSNKYRTSVDTVKKMSDEIAHRGPDAEGQWCDQKVALGHRRLSIIDLSEESNQPMHSMDGRFVITYNGEIYNYIELRDELISMGVTFRTLSDTEVIIEAYRAWGEDCFNRFNGMWAFALYDKLKRRLILCRDRFGIKPLYIVNNEDALIFASEAKAILCAFPEYFIPNKLEIYRYLSASLQEDTDNMTFYEDINSFPRAEYWICDMDNNQILRREYWKVDEKLFKNKWVKGRNPYKTCQELFDSAVKLRMRADVEVGSCLSGGIDSSAVVGCLSRNCNNKIHTFSSVYEDKECNEEYYIQKVNQKNHTLPHYVYPDKDADNLPNYIREMTFHHDGPSSGASLYSQYKVMEEVSKYVKVVLDGQGADELFAGYITYYSYYIRDLMDKDEVSYKWKARKLMAIVMENWPDVIGAISTDTIVSLVGTHNSIFFQNRDRIEQMRIKRTEKQFTDDFLKELTSDHRIDEITLSSHINTRLCNDILSKSIPNLLHNEDGNSMAFSVESRVPFMDYRIVEFAIALDGKYKLHNQWTKWIERKALRKYLPFVVRKRVDKMGFPAPFSRWLKEASCKDDLKDTIYRLGKRNIIPVETIDSYYKSHITGKTDMSEILFRIYSLEIWFELMEERYGRV